MMLGTLENLWRQFKDHTHNGLDSKSIDSSGGGFVTRGTVAAYDFTQATLTFDGTINDIDLSAVIPSTATLVLIRLRFEGAVDNQFLFYPGDHVSGVNVNRFRTQVVSQYFETMAMVQPSSAGIIKYSGESTLTNLSMVVCGWWL